jgi:hypothetical protein
LANSATLEDSVSENFKDQAAAILFGSEGERDLKPLTNNNRLTHLSIMPSSLSISESSFCK